MWGDDKDDKASGVERGARHGALVFLYSVVSFSLQFFISEYISHFRIATVLLK